MTPNKLQGMIGLCRRAGKAIMGTPLVSLALREKNKPFLVLLSEGASSGTKDKITRKCTYYRVSLQTIPFSPEELAHTCGKTGALAVLAVTDKNFAEAILSSAEMTGKDGNSTESPNG